jgi:hypothetical protein
MLSASTPKPWESRRSVNSIQACINQDIQPIALKKPTQSSEGEKSGKYLDRQLQSTNLRS